MAGISFSNSGSFDNLERFLARAKAQTMYASLQAYGEVGVAALEAATPKDSGVAAGSWSCDVQISGSSATLSWKNSDIENGFPVAIMLQYGHGTGTGGYVQGIDYINPAIKPSFDKIADAVWKVVTAS